MEYHEAVDIAKKNPGAVLTRDASGAFIVRLTNGEVIGLSGTATDTFLRKRKEDPDILSRVQNDFSLREDQLLREIAELNETIAKLKGSISAAKLGAHQLSQQLEALKTENVSLQNKLSKVSEDEWERIRKADRVSREGDASRRKAERNIVKCACLGEVENCARCFGAGEYTVDGFGNSA